MDGHLTSPNQTHHVHSLINETNHGVPDTSNDRGYHHTGVGYCAILKTLIIPNTSIEMI